MRYRLFGNTGIEISALGLGAMRLPEFEKDGAWFIDEEKSIQIVHRAFELGVNYIDTAYPYSHGNNEYIVGKCLKGYRDKVYLSTKHPTWLVEGTSDYRKYLEEQLERLGTDYIDFYHLHTLGRDFWDNKVLKYNLLDEAIKAKEEGLIKHISFSFHDKPEVMKEIIDSGVFETVLCQYNLLDRSNEDAITYAKEKGLGVVIMGPVAGGNLSVPSSVITESIGLEPGRTPEVALRFVLGNPHVSCALSGVSTLEMLEENARIASMSEPLTPDEMKKLNEMIVRIKSIADKYCSKCNYCMPCPQGINIPFVLDQMNYHKVYGLTEIARKGMSLIGKEEWTGKPPSDCIDCGVCETKCPQKVDIRNRLKDIVREFEA